MKVSWLAGGVFLIIVFGFVGCFYREKVLPPVPVAGVPVITVQMDDAGYSTTTITVAQGDTVAFANTGAQERWPASDLHPTHELYSDFDPRAPVYPGETWAFRFERCGTWRFHDHLAPNIRGAIKVLCEQ